MPIPDALLTRLRLPVIAAPMFLVSGPDLVVEVCRSGVIGAFPALNQRSSEGFSAWLEEISGRLADIGDAAAPFAVNLIVHRSNPRLAADLDIVARHKVPLVITSLGAVRDVVDT
ncbi:nitronate monooxygenase, partial [Mesorhizobium sp. M2C.T.Ca.TU.009.01.2.1]